MRAHHPICAPKPPQLVEGPLIASDCDLLLRVLAKDLDDCRRFQIEHLGRIEGVRDIKIAIPVQKGNQSAELPVR